MTKHTPGPWSATRTRYGYFVQASGLDIAQVRNTLIGVGTESDHAPANAALIAAAPELLMVLQNFYHHFSSPGCNPFLKARELTPDDWNTLVLGARAAIAKAEGEAE